MLIDGQFKRQQSNSDQVRSVIDGQINSCMAAGFHVSYVKTLGSDFKTAADFKRVLDEVHMSGALFALHIGGEALRKHRYIMKYPCVHIYIHR